jgi:NAD(P)-dependent dehydrogenase (short-subunit alcohol dehydrogenase family)
MFRLENKVALVTRAGSGIGGAIARIYAQQGAQVVIGDIRSEVAKRVATSIQENGGKATALAFDVADEVQVSTTMQTIASTLG